MRKLIIVLLLVALLASCAKPPEPTPTPTATSTPEPTSEWRTLPSYTPKPTNTLTGQQKTSEVVRATNAFIARYTSPDRRDFMTYPEKMLGDKIKMSCLVFNVVNNKSIQCYIPNTYDAFYVSMSKSFDSLYKDDRIIIYGDGAGETCFTNRMGVQTCQPFLEDAFFIKP